MSAAPAPCRHLRTKKLYIPSQAAEAMDDPEDSHKERSHCWCNQTMTEIGGDDRPVLLRACSTPGRPCYED